MFDTDYENPLEYCNSADSLEENTKDLVESDYTDYVTESVGAVAQRTISIVSNSTTKLSNAIKKATSLPKTNFSSIKELSVGKGYLDISDILIPTLPGFTGTYKDLSEALSNNKHLLDTVVNSTLKPTLMYLERLMSDKDLLSSRAPAKDVSNFKLNNYKLLRSNIGELFTANDNISMRAYGSVFGNLSEFDSTSKQIGDLYHAYSNTSSVNKVLELGERIDAVAQKLYFKYFSDPNQKVAKEVRSQVAMLLRESAIASETLAFYIHIVTIANRSFTNITTHLKSKIK
jgi:hypothetical protein